MAQALPQFNEGTQRWHETLPEGQPGLMIKGVDAKKMIAASKPVIKPAFNKESTALAPISDVSGGEEKQTMFQKMKSNLGGFTGAGNLLKGILAAVEESAMHLKDIALSIAPDSAAARDAAILGEDVGDEDGEDDDGKGEKKPGFFKRQAGKLPSFKKMAMVAIMAGIILFAEKIQPVIAIMLKVFKWVYNFLKTGFVAVWDWLVDLFSDPIGTLKDSLKAVLGGLASLGAWIWDKGIKPVWDWIAGLFDSGPGKWIADKFKAVVGVFVSIGSWIWEKAIEPIWTWIKGLFGFGEKDKTQEGDDTEGEGGIGTWIWDHTIGPVWDWIKLLFTNPVEALITLAKGIWGVYASVGKWIWNKIISPIWTWIKGLFGFGDKDKTQEGDDTEGEGGLGTWIWKNAIEPVWTWIKGLFTNPVEALITLATVIWGAYKSVGLWIWNKIISPVWTWIKGLFGFGDKDKTQEGDDTGGEGGLGTWIWKNTIEPVWTWIKGLFSNPVEALITLATAIWGTFASIGAWIWEKAIEPIWNWIKGLFSFGDTDKTAAEGEEKGWSVLSLISGVFTSIKEWFQKLFKFDSTSDIITSLVNVLTFVPNMLKDLISGATQWLLSLFGFDDASKKVANATDWTFGSLITGAFKAVKKWFLGIFGWGKDDKAKGPHGEDEEGWSVSSLISGVVQGIKDWFSKMFSFDSKSDVITSLVNVLTFVPNILKDMIAGVTGWLLGLFGFDDAAQKLANATNWTFGSLITGAFIAVKDWFLGIFGWGKEESAKGPHGDADEGFSLGTWIWDHTIGPIWDFFTGLFDNPLSTITEAIATIFGAYVSIGKWIWGMTIEPVWNWIKGLFGWGEDDEDTLKDDEGNEMSLWGLAKKAVSAVWGWLTGLFTFSDETQASLKQEFGQIKTFGKAIASGAWAAIKNIFGHPIDAFKEAFSKTLETGMMSDAAKKGEAELKDEKTSDKDLSPILAIVKATQESAMHLAAMTLSNGTATLATAGAGVTIVDQSNNQSTSTTTQDTYNQSELATDHNEQSGSWLSNIDWTPWN